MSEPDDKFIRAYERQEAESLDELVARHSGTVTELRSIIAHLIRRRELLRDAEIEVLERECSELATKLADMKRRVLLEELECFREVLALHKRLVEHGERRH